MKRLALMGWILLIIAGLVSGCGSTGGSSGNSTPQAVTKVRIANVLGTGGPPQGLVMIKKGILQEKLGTKYNIEPIYTRNIDQVSEEMKNEQYDFIFCYYGTIAEYASKLGEWQSGNNFVAIANVSNGPGSTLVSQLDIKDIKQLNGKTIGVFNHDYAGVTLLANTLKQYGLDITERGGTVKVRIGDSVKMTQDLRAGKLDAMMARSGFKGEGVHTLLDYNEMAYGGKASHMVLLARKAFVVEHPDVVEKLLDAHISATEWVKENRQETAEIIYPETEQFYKDRKAEQILPPKPGMIKIYSILDVNVYPNLKFIDDIWLYMEKYNKEKPYAMSDVTNFSYLDKVLKSKGMPSIEEYNKTEYKN